MLRDVDVARTDEGKIGVACRNIGEIDVATSGKNHFQIVADEALKVDIAATTQINHHIVGIDMAVAFEIARTFQEDADKVGRADGNGYIVAIADVEKGVGGLDHNLQPLVRNGGLYILKERLRGFY